MKLTIEVPDEHIAGALAHPNSRYWASGAQWDPSGRNCYVEELDGRDGIPERHRLDGTVERALGIMATQYTRHFAKLMSGVWDGETGDVLLQLMVFGELKYG